MMLNFLRGKIGIFFFLSNVWIVDAKRALSGTFFLYI